MGLSDVYTAIQNGVVALNNLGLQVQGSLRNISGQLTAISCSVTAISSQYRPILSSDRFYYVRTDGLDTNSGLINSSSGALATWPTAFAKTQTVDFGGKNVTLFNGNAGAYSASNTIPVNSAWVGGGSLILDGNGGSLNSSNSLNIAISNGITLPGQVLIQNFTLTGATGISHSGVGLVTLGSGMNFGACINPHMQVTSPGGYLAASFISYTISGGARNHIFAADQGRIDNALCTIAITTAVTFSSAFCWAERLALIVSGLSSFTGSSLVTGKRYAVEKNSLIDINLDPSSAAYFPGTIAGTSATGGLYV